MSKFRMPEKCLVELLKFNEEDGYLPLVRYTCLKKRTTFIYIFFVIIIFVYFSNCQTRIVGPVLIREFIGSLTVDYSPLDHARLTCLKVKIVILFLG